MVDARPETIGRPCGAARQLHGAGALHFEFDTDADVAGWTPTAPADSGNRPGVLVYGWPIEPVTDSSTSSDETPPGRPLCALELADFVAANGFEAVERLRGSFVVVIIDPGSGRVDCYRSRAGGRTAYWAAGSSRWSISSSAVRASRGCGRSVREEPRWLARFFALSSEFPTGTTPFEGVEELMPGEHLTISGDRITTRRTPLTLTLKDKPRRVSQWVETFGIRLERAVADCLPADRPAAVMLSGGMDSGPAAVIASHHATRQRMPLQAVSWRIKGFPECDEWEWISMLARHLGIRLTAIDADNHIPFSSLTEDQVDSESPFYNAFRPMILACYENSRRLGCEVILNAASGDALYPRSARALLDDIAHADVQSAMRRIIEAVRQYGPLGMHRAVEFRALASAILMRHKRSKISIPSWLTRQAGRHLAPLEIWPNECARSLHPEFGQKLFGPTASGDIAKESCFSRRYGVDRRDPYLDPDLRRLMLQMPHALIWRHGTSKWVAREAMRGRMPESFRTKPRTGLLTAFFKHGFDLHRGKIREFLMDQQSLWSSWVDPGYLKPTLDGELSEERPRLVAGTCIGYVLWKKRIDQG